MAIWFKYPCRKVDVMLDFVLACGQSFRWTRNDLGEWIGVIGSRVWKLRQDDDSIEYQIFPPPNSVKPQHCGITYTTAEMGVVLPSKQTTMRSRKKPKVDEKFLVAPDTHALSPLVGDDAGIFQRYFALDTSITPLYDLWSSSDERFAAIAPQYQGIRVLRQDFLENLFSFICSSNNNIKRIQQMVEKLCTAYGEVIWEIDGTPFHAFPPVSRLAHPSVEGDLRKMGFGYRAKFVFKSAEYITQNPDWLERVTVADYPTAKALLMELPGVGAKVADCICLMSLGHHEAVPVDTHVFSVTAQYYLPHLKHVRSVTTRVYNEIGAFYRERFGPMAGWAHSVLFTADLRQFKNADNLKLGNNNITRKKRARVECD